MTWDQLPVAVWPLCAVLIVAIGVGGVRAYALRARVIDHPNERSSHAEPTPRGGGVAILLTLVALGMASAVMYGDLTLPLAGAWAGMLLVGVVGWRDDHGSVSVRSRLAAQIVSAVPIVALVLHGAPMAGIAAIGVGAWWLFWTVSAVNVVNFTDGIDGLVASQLIIAGCYLAALSPVGGYARLLGLLLAAACAGFLPWNFPRAKIFLGDVGSGSLGYVLAMIGLLVARASGRDLLTIYLPLFPVFLDAAVTIVRRALRGHRVTTPHRAHLYQRMANGGAGHVRVTLAYAAAALGGVAIGLSSHASTPWPLVGYCVTVVAVGAWLDRRFPFTNG